MTEPKSKDNDFFDKPATIRWILRVFYSICVLLVFADFIVHRHIETAIEKIPAFYTVFGFVACVILVLLAVQMRKFIIRDEHYYDEHYDESDSQPQNSSLEKGDES
ncbi:MAG: hypothetical protein AAFZ92_04215 [Pseudomonadota bacterium]